MSSAPYDPRSIANLLLDRAAEKQYPISNLALQKLLYFVHALFLMRTKEPVVQGAFEAWEYGPVHPAVYRAFKSEGKKPISIRAVSRDIITGHERELDLPDNPVLNEIMSKVLDNWGRLPAGRLVEISHAPKGPWAHIVKKMSKGEAITTQIPDSVTRELFRYTMVVPDNKDPESPDEDTPLTHHRFG